MPLLAPSFSSTTPLPLAWASNGPNVGEVAFVETLKAAVGAEQAPARQSLVRSSTAIF